jgi:bifunctional NMN adenylyltransferase/nudix hydrolase
MSDEKVIYDTSYQATDSVIIRKATRELLLGRKKDATLFRFIGGFVDPKDDSLENASVREKNEEAGINLECSEPAYLGSFRVDDPRYRNSRHKIMSAVFYSYVLWGMAKAGDDIVEVKWMDIDDFKKHYLMYIVPEHFPIVAMLEKKQII